MAKRKGDPVVGFLFSPFRGSKVRKDPIHKLVKKVKPAKTRLGYILTGKGKPKKAKKKKDNRTASNIPKIL
jgi:hypothetical protein